MLTNTSFVINSQSLFQMYVELYGDNTQSGNFPAKVYLKLLHMSSSYFRDGNGNIKEFRQKLGDPRTFEFNRFAITNTTKCNEQKKKGISKYFKQGIFKYFKLLNPCLLLFFITVN